MIAKIARLVQRYRLSGAEYARWLGASVGKNCRIYTSSWGTEPFLISIGDDVTISEGVLFLNHDGASALVRDDRGRRHSVARISVGSNVFIGARTIVMPGVSIGDNVVIGAGSVVTKSMPSGIVAAGTPAKFICTLEEYIRKSRSLPAESDLVRGTHRERMESALRATGAKDFIRVPLADPTQQP